MPMTKGMHSVALFSTLALAFHTLLCLGFLGLAGLNMAGMVRVLDTGPDTPDWGQTRLNAVFYLSGTLYLLYAEIYLYQVQSLASLGR